MGRNLPNECTGEHAIVERLLRASVDIYGALALVREQRTGRLLREAVDCLDESIKQVQARALDAQLGPQLARTGTRMGRVRLRQPRLAARMATTPR
jgi:hypothetical protein